MNITDFNVIPATTEEAEEALDRSQNLMTEMKEDFLEIREECHDFISEDGPPLLNMFGKMFFVITDTLLDTIEALENKLSDLGDDISIMDVMLLGIDINELIDYTQDFKCIIGHSRDMSESLSSVETSLKMWEDEEAMTALSTKISKISNILGNGIDPDIPIRR